MSTITPTFSTNGDGSVVTFTWAGLTTTADTGLAVGMQWAPWADRTVQVLGSFGTGGTVLIQGSNDGGATYATLNDPGSSALSIQAAKIKSVLELTETVRPFISAGDGTTSLTVVMVCRRTNSMRR